MIIDAECKGIFISNWELGHYACTIKLYVGLHGALLGHYNTVLK